MRRRMAVLLTAICWLMALCLLTGCAQKPVRHGMMTVDGLTFLVSTLTRGEEISVTVTMTNGTDATLFLRAPEMAAPDGNLSAAYLMMDFDGRPDDRAALTDTGDQRWLCLDPRESYSETRVFSGALPGVLCVTVESAPTYNGAFTPTAVEMKLEP